MLAITVRPLRTLAAAALPLALLLAACGRKTAGPASGNVGHGILGTPNGAQVGALGIKDVTF